HIVVRRLFEHDRAYIVQTYDRRGVFALPFGRGFTLFGTTGQSFAGAPGGIEPPPRGIALLFGGGDPNLLAALHPPRVGWVVRRRSLALRRRLEKSAGCNPRLCPDPRSARR